tara:strand:+ start:329 stop:691 length:363 start_codon:yes stop_codon:yes gene_type:complete
MSRLSCHCRAVQIDVLFKGPKKQLVRCNCSICKRKGAIMAIVDTENIKILKGKDLLKTYTFHTKVAQHFFCSICGIYTHHYQRRDPTKCGVNVGCLENFETDPDQEIKLIDGKNHPLDKK